MLLEGNLMKVVIKFGDNLKEFENQDTIVIGSSVGSDFEVPNMASTDVIKMVYAEKYNNYVLMNVSQNKELLCNGKTFSKLLVNKMFTIAGTGLPKSIEVEVIIDSSLDASNNQEMSMQNNNLRPNVQTARASAQGKDVFDHDVERQRIAIIKEIGFKLLELKANIKSAGITTFVLNVAMVILSVVSSFAITNFLLGFKIDNTSSVLNLTTNF